MPILRQLSLFVDNKPGALADVTKVLAAGKVNLVALAVPDARAEGVLRLVPSDPNQAKSILKARGIAFSETKVLGLELPDRPGAVYDVAQKLAKEKIDIAYAYGSTNPHEGVTTIIFHVSDLMKAQRVLEVDGAASPPKAKSADARGEGHHSSTVVKINRR